MRTWHVVGACLLLVIAGRVALFPVSVGADEGGLLMVASQWHDGTSLYGDHWVDRPPLLIAVFELATARGGITPLRVMGILATCAFIVGAAVAGQVVAGDSGARAAAVVSTLFSVSVLMDAQHVGAGTLAAPLTMWSCALLLIATQRAPSARTMALVVTSGAMAGAAVMLKQSLADATVFATVLVASRFVRDREPRTLGRTIAAFAAGWFGAIAAVVVGAWTRGTAPGPLGDALVTFRVEAAAVISGYDSLANAERAVALFGSWLAMGLALLFAVVVVVALRPSTRRPAVVATAVGLLYGTAAVATGGSYWAHYLQQPAPLGRPRRSSAGGNCPVAGLDDRGHVGRHDRGLDRGVRRHRSARAVAFGAGRRCRRRGRSPGRPAHRDLRTP